MHDRPEHAEALPFDRSEVDGSIHQRLLTLAETCGDDTALSDGDADRFTYAELAEAVGRAGRWIVARTPDASCPVALLMPNRPLAIATELAVLAAGRIVMPLEPTFPPARLADMVHHGDPSLVLCDPSTEKLARSLVEDRPEVEIVVWDALPASEGPDEPADLPVLDGRSPAFLLFTSGSTGRPKGALANHRAFLSGSRDLGRAGVLRRGDRLAMVAPLSFAAAPCQTLWAMLAGAEVCTFPLRERGLPAFLAWMARSRITAFATVPTLARAIAGASTAEPQPALRVVMAGGETLQNEDVALIRGMSALPIDLVPLYVSTEMMLMSWGLIDAGTMPDELGTMTIGSPVEDRVIELLPYEHAVSDDVGEIAVTAPTVTAGYWRDPALTAARFDFDEAADQVRFRTGDLGRATPDGIEIVGRVDSMVKIRGARVELGAIEAAMRDVADVVHVAAVAVDDANGAKRVIAHAAGAPDGPRPSRDAIRSHLRTELAQHMQPAQIVVHDALPQLPNGKVDRFALSQQRPDEPSAATARPRTDTERRLVKLFQSLLGGEEPGIDEDFFELGGDSLLAVQVVIFLEEEFGVVLPMSTWIELSTIEQIARRVDARTDEPLDTLVRVQQGDESRAPLFVVNDLHGSAFRFAPLAEALGSDQPVWGFDSPLLRGTADAPATIEQIARTHIDDLVAAHPNGPYHLVGYSSNVLVVFEMARQLPLLGHEVGFVGLIDFGPVHVRHSLRRDEGPRPPGSWPERAPSDLGLLARARHHARRVQELAPSERVRYLSRALDVAKPYDLALARWDLRRHGRVRSELRGAYSWYLQMDSALRYRPTPIDAAAVLFLSDQTAKANMMVSRKLDYASASDPELGWHGLFRGGLRVEPVIGHHNDLIEEPYVEQVGLVIRRTFDNWLRGA